MARQAQAKYEISAEDRTKQALDSASRGLKTLKDAAFSLQGVLAGVGAAFSIKQIIDNTVRQEAALKQLEAALQSTGGAIGYTRDQLAQMAAELQGVTTFGDEAIIEAQARLVTYTGIVGTNFPRALQAVLDQSARLNIGLEQSAEVIGRALESPIKAASALADQGFAASFTKEVQATIRSLVEAGREAEAQVLILEILESSYGGAARAARDTFGGALTALGNAFGDLLEAEGGLNDAKAAIEELTVLLSDPRAKKSIDELLSSIVRFSIFAIDAADGVSRAFSGLGKTIGAAAAQLAAVLDGDFQRSAKIGQEWLKDMDDLLQRPFFSQMAEANAAAMQQAAKTASELKKEFSRIESGGGAAVSIPPINLTKALLERQTALLRDALNRQLQDLDRAYQDGLTSTAAYFAERRRLQTESLDAELERLRGALAQAQREEAQAAATTATTDGEAKSAIAAVTRAREQQIQVTGQITLLERDRAAIAGQAARDQAAAERDLARELQQVRIRLLELSGETAQARSMALENEYQGLLKRLAAEGDAQGQSLVRRLFDVEAARAQLDQLQEAYALAMERMSTQEQSIAVQRDTGLLTEMQARAEIIDLHRRTSQEVAALIPKMLELAAATGDPMAIERVKQMELQLKRLQVVSNEVGMRIKGALKDGLADAFADIITGAQSASDAFRSFASVVAQELARG